jgi:uncharacterized protein YndB with AHSA1/START domain
MSAGATRQVPWTCRVEADVAAPVEAVWAVVADVTRTGEWSHECHEVAWVGRAHEARPGARFRGTNHVALWRWRRTCEVLAVEPGRSLVWRTVPTWRYVDSTEWRITLEPLEGGTRIVQTYQVVRCPRWWAWLVARVVPPHLDRSAGLRADLARIGEVATADAAA